MTRDPFAIEGPAIVSFSGGRTSGYMLYRILQAWGGSLPPDIKVAFANTGKEMPETLDFVRDCQENWGVEIAWLEYRERKVFAQVSHATASRKGEPYAALIRDRNYLPNPVTRFCTSALKLEPIAAYARSQGFEDWDEVVGLRADEPARLARIDKEKSTPLARAGITKGHIAEFWQSQNWNLKLPRGYSNCDLCFLKGAGQISAIMREHPETADWWIEMEEKIGSRFRSDRPSYAEMAEATRRQYAFDFGDARIDCYCSEDRD